MAKLDWRWLHSFALVVQHGGISAAAHASHLSQPTLSRHMKSLEEYYDSPLLRHAGGLTVTALGELVLRHALSMAENADDVESLARSGLLSSGNVRLSVSPAIAQQLLPRVLNPIPAAVTNVEVMLEGAISDVLRRESDIAIRLFRPTQLELKTRKVGEIHYGVYVHRRLVGKKRKVRKDDLLAKGVDLVGVVKPNVRERKLLKHLDLDPSVFRVACDDRRWRTAAVELGIGAGVVPEYVASQSPELIRVEDIDAPIVQEVWMTTSKASIAGRATKSLFDTLSTRIKAVLNA